ncbi:MAG TPA: winged helix-turn-helix transcriptional regulator [Candidatus Thermoplasmatota archaeon]|nr:winged helix-turn-helix transcriptional regulator [Candidatus Thermoplasmatota archaeon]
MPPSRSSDLLPPPDVEYLLAHRLLADRNPLRKSVVLELVGRPRRYGELRSALGIRSDNRLTRALRYLQEDGIVDQRMDLGLKPGAMSYELSPLGRLVLIRMLQMIPAEDSARLLLRGKAASARAGAEG